jgi:hypothetical protein
MMPRSREALGVSKGPNVLILTISNSRDAEIPVEVRGRPDPRSIQFVCLQVAPVAEDSVAQLVHPCFAAVYNEMNSWQLRLRIVSQIFLGRFG